MLLRAVPGPRRGPLRLVSGPGARPVRARYVELTDGSAVVELAAVVELHLAAEGDDLIAGADLVITGEGRFDATSLRGKVCGEVAGRAAAHGVPVAVVAGSAAPAARTGDLRSVSLRDLADEGPGRRLRCPRPPGG